MLVSALRAYGYCTDMPHGALYVWVKAKSGDCWKDLEQLAEDWHRRQPRRVLWSAGIPAILGYGQ